MEFLPFLVLFYFLFKKKKDCEIDTKSNFTKIDDKHFIINNKFVSFDEDDSIKVLEQEREDNRHYHRYETDRLLAMYKRYDEMYFNTIMAITPELENTYTHKDIIKYYEEYYYEYAKVVDKLNEHFRCGIGKLDIHQYIIFKKNPIECKAFLSCQLPIYLGGVYNITNFKHAKYANGDMMKIMGTEFEEKWINT